MKFIAMYLIKFYQYFISPLLGNRCRFYPSCSEYCKVCFEKFSFFKALWYSVSRLKKCHPYNDGGVDYPPSNVK